MRELFAFYHSSNASRVINNTPEIKYPSSPPFLPQPPFNNYQNKTKKQEEEAMKL